MQTSNTTEPCSSRHRRTTLTLPTGSSPHVSTSVRFTRLNSLFRPSRPSEHERDSVAASHRGRWQETFIKAPPMCYHVMHHFSGRHDGIAILLGLNNGSPQNTRHYCIDSSSRMLQYNHRRPGPPPPPSPTNPSPPSASARAASSTHPKHSTSPNPSPNSKQPSTPAHHSGKPVRITVHPPTTLSTSSTPTSPSTPKSPPKSSSA